MRRKRKNSIPKVVPTALPRTRAKIYGAMWPKIADPTCIRTDDAIGMVAAAGVDSQIVNNDSAERQ